MVVVSAAMPVAAGREALEAMAATGPVAADDHLAVRQQHREVKHLRRGRR
jgi:ribosomal protein S28E/S33